MKIALILLLAALTPGSYQLSPGSYSFTTPSPTPTPSPIACNFYASPSGGGNGLSSGNPTTLIGAQTLARGAANSAASRMVCLESGTYTLAANLVFTSADSNETLVPLSGQGLATITGSGNFYITTSGDTGLSFYGLKILAMSGSFPNYGASLNLNGTSENVRWCEFDNFGATAIAGTFQHALIDSNTFNGSTAGTCGGGPCSAASGYYGAGNSTISHNLCENLAGQCAQFNTANTGQVNDTISYNASINTLQNCDDCGTYYAFDTSSAGTSSNNLQIINNTAFGGGPIANGTKCIYLDQAISGATITGNICAQNDATGNQPGTMEYFIHGGQNNNFSNNIIQVSAQSAFTPFGFSNAFNGTVGFIYQTTSSTTMGGNVIQHNIFFSNNGWPGGDVGFDWNISSTGITAPAFSANDYYNSSGGGVPGSWGSYTDSAPVTTNPGFASPATNNYAVSNPPAGWTTLPTNQGPVGYAP